MCKARPERNPNVPEDIVDSFYGDLVQPLGNLVILFAQAEASLVGLVIELDGSIDQRAAQRILKADDAKQQVPALAQTSGLVDFELKELLNGIDQYWADKEYATVISTMNGSLHFATAVSLLLEAYH